MVNRMGIALCDRLKKDMDRALVAMAMAGVIVLSPLAGGVGLAHDHAQSPTAQQVEQPGGDAAAGALSVHDPYGFATAPGVANGAGFMVLTYPVEGDGSVPDRLIGAQSPVAERTEIHTMNIEDNVMTMRRIESLPLPPTGRLAMTPAGVHIMFMGLKAPLVAGTHIPLDLIFEKAGRVAVQLAVRAPGDISHNSGDHSGDHQHH